MRSIILAMQSDGNSPELATDHTLVETSGGAVVDLLNTSVRLAQLGILQASEERPVFPPVPLLIHQQPESLMLACCMQEENAGEIFFSSVPAGTNPRANPRVEAAGRPIPR